MDIIKLLNGATLLFLAQAFVWFQMYAPLKIEWFKDKQWISYVIAIPITFLFMKGIEICVECFDGVMWPARLFTFTLGVISFTFLTSYFNQEPITPKTGVCLLLCLMILLVQIFWKS